MCGCGRALNIYSVSCLVSYLRAIFDKTFQTDIFIGMYKYNTCMYIYISYTMILYILCRCMPAILEYICMCIVPCQLVDPLHVLFGPCQVPALRFAALLEQLGCQSRLMSNLLVLHWDFHESATWCTVLMLLEDWLGIGRYNRKRQWLAIINT